MARTTKSSTQSTGRVTESPSLDSSTESRRRKLLLDILDDEQASNAERISAIKELRAMEDGQNLATDGFSTWPRARIVAELDRLSAQQRG